MTTCLSYSSGILSGLIHNTAMQSSVVRGLWTQGSRVVARFDVFPTLQYIFLRGTRTPNTWAQGIDPGNLEKGPNKIPGIQPLYGPSSRRTPYNALKSLFPFISSSSPSPHRNPVSIFPSDPHIIGLTCKRMTRKHFILNSNAPLRRFPISQAPFVYTHRRIA